MEQEASHYQVKIDQLRSRFAYDLVALAFVQSAEDDFVLTWQFASGNLNDRYKRVVLRSGKGIAGIVFKTGKPMVVTDVETELNKADIFNYPIVVAERLQSLAALPLYKGGRVMGILLVGYRDRGKMTQEKFAELRREIKGYFGAYSVKELV